MTKPLLSDEEFIKLFQELGAEELARRTGLLVRGIYFRRKHIELKLNAVINSPNAQIRRGGAEYPKRIGLSIDTGTVIVGSDAHWWPGELKCGTRGFNHLIRELQPKIVFLNGDAVDGARISRHPPIGWTNPPSLKDELREVEARTDEIRSNAKGAELIWTLGNHDRRFENKLAAQAPEYAGVKGFTLKEHFPHWRFCVSAWINNIVVVKHRYKGGEHATHTNTLRSGKTMVTGHLHSLKVTPFSDYPDEFEDPNPRTRWGVDTGTLEDPYSEQFDYDEDNPKNHRAGFIVLTFWKGMLLWPEIAAVIDANHIQFRGKVIKV